MLLLHLNQKKHTLKLLKLTHRQIGFLVLTVYQKKVISIEKTKMGKNYLK